MPRLFSTLLLTVLLLWAPGCKKKGASDHVKVGLSGPVTVKLVDPGKAPRRVLRYRFAAGVTKKLRMEVSAGLAPGKGASGKQAPVRWPTYRLPLRIHRSRLRGGRLTLRWRAGTPTLLRRGTIAPEQVGGFRKALRKATGLRGQVTLSDRGIPTDVAVRLPLTLPGQVKKVLRNGVRQLVMPVTPLPAEPVGKGARWLVRLPLKLSGMTLTQRVEVQLEHASRRGARVRWAITQPAPARADKSAGGHELPALRTAGYGQGNLTFGGFAPRWSRRLFESHMAKPKLGKEPFDLTLSFQTDVVLKPE